jgi:hypothetical protein
MSKNDLKKIFNANFFLYKKYFKQDFYFDPFDLHGSLRILWTFQPQSGWIVRTVQQQLDRFKFIDFCQYASIENFSRTLLQLFKHYQNR